MREGLDAIARTRHGQAPPTLLEERYLAALGFATTDELFEAISRHGLRVSAELAPLVLLAAADGDAAAAAIAQQMGESLAAAVVGVARILDMQDDVFEVVCAGGVHGAESAALDSAFRAALSASCPASIPVALTAPPAIGAALLALERVTDVDVDVHDRLLGEIAGSVVVP